MHISHSNGIMYVSGIEFDPHLTLIDSAQVFHWKERDGIFSGTADGHAAQVLKTEDGFCIRGVEKEEVGFWTKYFDLERDYGEIQKSCEAYPNAQRAMQLLPGLRVLNQPAWETLLAFIISANNNVSRIRSIVERMIERFGTNGAFPSPECLSEVKEEELRAIGCGYRAAYLKESARMVVEGFPLNELYKLPYEQAHGRLLELSGVGDKVADCVQLFGMGYSEAFPVDVWVERLMKQWFEGNEGLSRKSMRNRAQEMFGKNAGIIQQSLFHCARLGLIELKKD